MAVVREILLLGQLYFGSASTSWYVALAVSI